MLTIFPNNYAQPTSHDEFRVPNWIPPESRAGATRHEESRKKARLREGEGKKELYTEERER